MAKSATAAVRMSLDLLQLTADEEYLLQQGEEEEEEDLADQEGSTAGAEGGDADLKIKVHMLLYSYRNILYITPLFDCCC